MSKQDSLPVSSVQAAGFVILANRTIVRVSGPGADKFVQGQFTQHVDEVTEGQSLRAAACTPKGRTYCLTRLVRDGNDLLMDLENSLIDNTLSHLRKYLMLFRGTTMDALPTARIIGLIGESAATAVAGNGARTLKSPGQVLQIGDSHLIRIENTYNQTPRYEWWQPNEEHACPPDVSEITLDHWRESSIAAGVPWLTQATIEAYVPQMLNLQHLQGVHFKKGCYTGQEVIARMHFLGQLKKSLYRLSFKNTNQAPEEGTRLLMNGKSAGEVVNAIMTGNQQGELLAVIRHDADPDLLSLEGQELAKLHLEPLPYPVPEQDKRTQADT
ncbi:folate-binding protein YgfZ [Marinobacter sp.]|uniref:CAF17-like 4Fe-4S cluster assembly/insertion protein YgfZ n=1 Tax=Marinobacter sp. TaxID=50741 RepID=UPI0035680C3A